MFNLKSWLTGFVLGLAGKPLPTVAPRPAACLCNGVRFPTLPVWDKTTYPHAYITNTYGNYHLYCTDTPLNATFLKSSDSLSGVNSAGIEVNYLRYAPSDDEKTWNGPGTSSLVFAHVYKPVWANTDMEKYYYADGEYTATGTVGLAASDPVPVYE